MGTLDSFDLNNETSIELKSNSKINLGLWIKEKRSDGYHEIETIFYENKNLYDELEISFIKNSKSSITVNFIQDNINRAISQDKNLAYVAAKLYFEKLKVAGECKIIINKKIPLEAGLGGGSSNAAFVLKGLNHIFNDKLAESALLKLASKVGSDVPFFIVGGTCLATGRGEKLSRLENNLNLDIKIVKPDVVSISTKWAYEQIDSRKFVLDRREEIDNLILAMKNNDIQLFTENVFNDFETVAFSAFPNLAETRKHLLTEGFKAVTLCGSGSALFGIR